MSIVAPKPGVPLRGRPWLHTFRGLAWCADAPHLFPYDIAEIAHALSNLCRFAGHTKFFYSVATHSVLVAEETRKYVGDKRVWRAALLHDAAEAFLVDLPAPVKRLPELAGYRSLIDRTESAIAEYFALGVWAKESIVHHCDLVLLATEKRDVLGPSPHDGDWGVDLPEPSRTRIQGPMYPDFAKRLFLEAWESYGGSL